MATNWLTPASSCVTGYHLGGQFISPLGRSRGYPKHNVYVYNNIHTYSTIFTYLICIATFYQQQCSTYYMYIYILHGIYILDMHEMRLS